MNKCINLKQKFNKTLYCKKLNKEINIRECNNCQHKEFKSTGFQYKSPDKTGIKKRSSKLAKSERNRESIFTDDLTKCIICGKSPVNKHEIFGGRNRQLSIKYKLVVPFCLEEHHNQIACKGIHFNKDMQDYWHRLGQKKFMEYYGMSKEEFVKIFDTNYLK